MEGRVLGAHGLLLDAAEAALAVLDGRREAVEPRALRVGEDVPLLGRGEHRGLDGRLGPLLRLVVGPGAPQAVDDGVAALDGRVGVVALERRDGLRHAFHRAAEVVRVVRLPQRPRAGAR